MNTPVLPSANASRNPTCNLKAALDEREEPICFDDQLLITLLPIGDARAVRIARAEALRAEGGR